MTSTPKLTPCRGGKVCLSLALLIGAPLAGDAWSAASCGQPQEVTGRPRIGLALAGGGGKGWAHVGVLKVLEELRVPIDCIAGTSAGSIIGGVYASGMSPEEMEKVVLGADWGTVFQDSAPRQDQSFDRKREDLRGLWDLELGVGKGGVKVPSGIFAGQEVNALLRRLTTSAVGVRSFDDLQIPFRAVATDLTNGELVILDHGELAAAMRASMAVPGAFTPETIDGRLLVDGGLRQNLPVQTVRAMGADVVIAVDLGTTTTPTTAQLANPVAVAQQMVNILLDLNVYASREALKPGDVHISPKVEGFSSGDFGKGPELVPIGEKAARAMQDRLLALSLTAQQYAALREAQRARSKAGSQVARVEVDASQLRHVNPAYVKEKFSVEQRKGELDEQRVRSEISALLGEGDYERIDYRYEDQPDGQRALVITPREKPWGPGYLRLGLQLATDFKEDTYFNLLGSYRRTWLNSWAPNGATIFRWVRPPACAASGTSRSGWGRGCSLLRSSSSARPARTSSSATRLRPATGFSRSAASSIWAGPSAATRSCAWAWTARRCATTPASRCRLSRLDSSPRRVSWALST